MAMTTLARAVALAVTVAGAASGQNGLFALYTTQRPNGVFTDQVGVGAVSGDSLNFTTLNANVFSCVVAELTHVDISTFDKSTGTYYFIKETTDDYIWSVSAEGALLPPINLYSAFINTLAFDVRGRSIVAGGQVAGPHFNETGIAVYPVDFSRPVQYIPLSIINLGATLVDDADRVWYNLAPVSVSNASPLLTAVDLNTGKVTMNQTLSGCAGTIWGMWRDRRDNGTFIAAGASLTSSATQVYYIDARAGTCTSIGLPEKYILFPPYALDETTLELYMNGVFPSGIYKLDLQTGNSTVYTTNASPFDMYVRYSNSSAVGGVSGTRR